MLVIFVVWIFFIRFERKINLNVIKKVCKYKDFCGVLMLIEDTKILELHQYQKFDETPSIMQISNIWKKIDGCKKIPEISPTTKVGEHTLSGFSMSTISSFKDIKKEHSVCRGEDCKKKFCQYLKKHVKRIVNFKK